MTDIYICCRDSPLNRHMKPGLTGSKRGRNCGRLATHAAYGACSNTTMSERKSVVKNLPFDDRLCLPTSPDGHSTPPTVRFDPLEQISAALHRPQDCVGEICKGIGAKERHSWMYSKQDPGGCPARNDRALSTQRRAVRSRR